MLRNLLLSTFALLLLTSCASVTPAPALPTPDMAATEAAIVQRVLAGLTAAAPTPQPAATPAPAGTATAQLPPTAVVHPTTVPTAVTPVPSSTPLPPASTATPVPSPTPSGPMALIQSDTLNVRGGPGTAHPIVATGKKGQSLPVSGRTQDGAWLEVSTTGGAKGWVSAELVQLNAEAQKVGVAPAIPTPPAVPTPAPQPATGKRDLEVTFINPHYDCEQGDVYYLDDKGVQKSIWGYRYFQVDLYIKNNGSTPVTPPWRPKRWIISDGSKDVVSDLSWEWVSRRTGFFEQPVIQPGQTAGWTYISSPIDRNQWMKAAEFVWEGQIYRTDFDLGPARNNYNYRDCGDPRPHTDRPTPTPKP